jgi:hypothetical protein
MIKQINYTQQGVWRYGGLTRKNCKIYTQWNSFNNQIKKGNR